MNCFTTYKQVLVDVSVDVAGECVACGTVATWDSL